jgi:predicted DNA-binding transcriptional regulator AlpA
MDRENHQNVPEFMRTRELAELTSLSTSFYEKARVTGVGGPPWCRAGRVVIYRRSDVDEWLAATRRESTSQKVA